MKAESIENPSKEESLDIIRNGFSNKRLISIFGKCEVYYTGRASSYLGLGDRLTILKPDGSLLVHKKEKRSPVNWQPPGCSHEVRSDKDNIIVKSTRRNPHEKIRIIFDDLYLISSLKMQDYNEINLKGTEEDLREKVLENPELVEEDFTPIKKEKEMDFGYADIYGRDKNNNLVLIELKRSKADPDAVSQLKRYMDQFRRSVDEQDIRGILMSPDISKKAKKLLNEHNLEHKKVKFNFQKKKNNNITEKTLDEF